MYWCVVLEHMYANSNLGNFYTKLLHRNSYTTAAEYDAAVEQPHILFGKSEQFLYGIILSDNTGDTFCGGGTSAILGYCNGSDDSGIQILMKFTGLFQWRSRNTPAAWSKWISPLSNADLTQIARAERSNDTIWVGSADRQMYLTVIRETKTLEAIFASGEKITFKGQ